GGPNGLINVKMLRNAEMHTGAFPASRPNALSSVLELYQREGRTDKFGGNFTLGATDWGFLLEGPMGKKSSYMISARESFSQHMLKALGVPVLPTYADVQYKQVFHFDQKNELTLTGIGSYDKFELNIDADPTESLLYNVGYIPEGKQFMYAGGAVYKHYLDNSYYTIVLSRNYLNGTAQKFLDNDEETGDQILDYQSIEAENKFRIEHKIMRDDIEWEYGVNLEHDQVLTQNASIYTDRQANSEFLAYDTEFQMLRYGLYGSYAHRFFEDELDFFAGIRLDGNTYNAEMQNPLKQFSPRLALTWHATNQWNFNASAGIYYQLPPYVVMAYGEGKDLVNQDRLKYMRSSQAGLGVDFNTKEGYQFKVEGFYKKYEDYPFLLLDSISLANANANYVLVGNQPADASSDGRAYGVEFQVKQKYHKSYYWMLTYTFVVSQFADVDGSYVSSSWDNRHIASVALGKTFGKNWQVGIRWSFTGGNPYTPYDIERSSLQSVWDLNRRGLLDYSRLNEARLPVFHALDVRVDKQFNFKKWTLACFLDLQNAYMSPIAALPYLTVEREGETGAPITDPNDPTRYLTKIISSDTGRLIPSLGVLIDF
ncbi:MAG: TonB-dependent receptor, partial [Phaeodactylibacter sp.]|nr:TonB-dependent receptor [Phaeodactylibacter sp.]